VKNCKISKVSEFKANNTKDIICFNGTVDEIKKQSFLFRLTSPSSSVKMPKTDRFRHFSLLLGSC